MDFLDDIWDFVDRTATSGWDLATGTFDKALDFTESAFDWQFTHDYATAAQGQTGTSNNAGTQAAGTSYVAPTASGSDNTIMYVAFGVAGLLGAILIARMVK